MTRAERWLQGAVTCLGGAVALAVLVFGAEVIWR